MNTRRSVDELVAAVRLCRKSGHIVPALCLAFVAIDTLAALSRPRNRGDQGRQDFLDWVDRYLLPSSEIPCTALDLYGARCALLHAYSSSSKLAAEGKAKKLCWAWGETTSDQMQALADQSNDAGRLIAVHADHFLEFLAVAKRRFYEVLSGDPDLASLVEERAHSILVAVVP